MSEPQKPAQVTLQIELTDEIAQGMYVNMGVVQHSSSEFILDFIFIPPNQPKAKVRARLIMAPEHAKRLALVMQENVKHFEQRFGEITLPQSPPFAKAPMQ